MNRKTKTYSSFNRFFASLLTLLMFSTSLFAEPMNLSVLRNEVEQYYDSGVYEKEVKDILAQAREYLIEEALKNEREGSPKKLAVVLDIDETSLSNYIKMLRRNFLSIPKQIHQEILDANSPAIPGALELYQAALDNGIHVFFVTGRRESEMEATQLNLMRAGFKKWVGLYFRPEIYEHRSIVPFKSRIRKSIVEQGYTILASIGDQQSDLEGGYMQKGFKLPNPFYYLP